MYHPGWLRDSPPSPISFCMHHILSSDQSTLPENVHIVDMICINLNAYNTVTSTRQFCQTPHRTYRTHTDCSHSPKCLRSRIINRLAAIIWQCTQHYLPKTANSSCDMHSSPACICSHHRCSELDRRRKHPLQSNRRFFRPLLEQLRTLSKTLSLITYLWAVPPLVTLQP